MSDPLYAHAEQAMAVGSRSFTAAARLFPRSTRRSVLMLYAWCRHCDDVIDDQHLGFTRLDAVSTALADGAAADRLRRLRETTAQAYAGAPMAHPAFAAFQEVAVRHHIPPRLAYDHLAGFAMDVEGHVYRTLDDTLLYCYRVAGVVGLMMAHIMGVRDDAALDRACDLGMAFQLTNIARDIVDDAAIGRCYVPADWLAQAGIAGADLGSPARRAAVSGLAARLVDEAEPYYVSALAGLPALSWRCAWAIASARGVYRRIGIRVKGLGDRAWEGRVSTSALEKLLEVSVAAGLALSSRRHVGVGRPAALWTRPPSDRDPANHHFSVQPEADA